MKKLLLMLAVVGMIFTACEGGSPDDKTNGNPTEQPGGNGNGGNEGGENGGKDDVEIPADKTQAIKFQDEATKLLCTFYWDENEDGELSYEEAEAAEDLDTAFKGSSIMAFTEFKYFIGLAEIDDNAFEGCVSLVKITLPEQITTIGISAFEGCTNLKKIEIPDSVTEIGDWAFYGCTSLARVDISDLSAWCKIGFGSDANPLRNGAKLYLDNNEITELVIPSDITEIKKYAFNGCSSLTSVTIPDSVTSIGKSAFEGCSSLTAFYGKYASADKRCLIIDGVLNSFAPAGLTSYTIPDSVTSIGHYAFNNCSSLTSVTIPDSVTSIGESAFSYCSSLISVYCKPTTPPSGASWMFEFNAPGRKIYVPTASVEAYKSAWYWSDYKSSIVGYDF